jgi:hypothetical protein
VYESYEFYVSVICASYESWLCVCICVNMHFHLPFSKFCVYRRSAHIVRVCCVGHKLRAVFFLLGRQDFYRLNSLEVL